MTEHFILPDRLDSSAAPLLVKALLDRTGKPLALDAGEVEVIGALAFEIIVAAGLQWQAEGLSLTVTRPSAPFATACQTLGLKCDAPWQSTMNLPMPERAAQA